jgi:hypothetical protein
MLSRLLKTSARDFQLESTVLAAIGTALPPITFLGGPIDVAIDLLGASHAVNRRWGAGALSPLEVLVLPRSRAARIQSNLQHLKLPPVFTKMQDAFETFFCQEQRANNIAFTWIYEENMVNIRIEFAKGNVQLRVPLAVAVVLAVVFDLGPIEPAAIAEKTGLAADIVDAILARIGSAEFALLSVGETVSINTEFESDVSDYWIIAMPQLALSKPRMRAPTKDAYRAQVMKIMKGAKEMPLDGLLAAVREEVEKVWSFSREDYDRALVFLESIRLIKLVDVNPGRAIFVPD